MTRTRRIILAVLAALIFTVAGGSAAYADAPVPGMPDRDIGGTFFDIDNVGGGIGQGSCKTGASYFECYGVSAQFHTDADTGLVNGVGDRTKSTFNDVVNFSANILMSFAQAGTAATATLADNVYGTRDDYQVDPSGQGNYRSGNWLGALEPLWQTVSDALEQAFTQPFAPLIATFILIAGIIGLIRGHISKVFATFVLALVAVGAVTVGTDYPIAAGRGADKVIVETTTEFREAVTNTDNSASPGYAMVGGVADRIIVDRWIAAMLGDSTSPTAVKYGPILYKAQAYSWDEARQVRADPDGAGKTILERKQKEWGDAKEAIKDEDPDAYAHLTGEKGASNRVYQAFLMNVTWWAAMPMTFVSLVLAALGFLLIRLVVVFLPVIGLIGAIPKFHGLLKSTGELFAAAVVNVVVFGAIGTLVAVVNTFIMADSTGFDWGTRLLFAAIFTIIAWSATAPFRKLTRFVSNYDPFASAKGVLSAILGVLKTIAAGLVGGGVAGAAVAGQMESSSKQATAGEGLKPQAAQQTFPASYVRQDEMPTVVDAELSTPRVPAQSFAVDDVIDVDSYESTTYALPVTSSAAPDREPPLVITTAGPGTGQEVALTEETTVIPSRRPAREATQNDEGTYLIYDGGRYVIDSNGTIDRESEDADA